MLWEEQGHICLYTGRQIAISDFVGTSQKFDKEHTIPRSVGGDSTRMNLTLCDSRFNREVKKTKLPTELPNHDEIMARINVWKEKYESLDKQIRRQKKLSKGATTKDQKDAVIRKRHFWNCNAIIGEVSICVSLWRVYLKDLVVVKVLISV